MGDLYVVVKRFKHSDPNLRYETVATGFYRESSGADAALRDNIPEAVLRHITERALDPPSGSVIDDGGFHYELEFQQEPTREG